MGNLILQASPELRVASMFNQLQSQMHRNGPVYICDPVSGSVLFYLSSSNKYLWNMIDNLHTFVGWKTVQRNWYIHLFVPYHNRLLSFYCVTI